MPEIPQCAIYGVLERGESVSATNHGLCLKASDHHCVVNQCLLDKVSVYTTMKHTVHWNQTAHFNQ